MKDTFFGFFERLAATVGSAERLTAHYKGEESCFIRFNRGLVRQPGSVTQNDCTLRLISGLKQANMELSLSGVLEQDVQRGLQALETLRAWIVHLPDDPHLLLPEQPQSTERMSQMLLPDSGTMVTDILDVARGLDLVGILATGSIGRGFASTSGQRNWFTAHPFSFDWCIYHHGDKAVKSTWSGFEWDRGVLEQKMESAQRKLAILDQPVKKLAPGRYRTYLTPAAVSDLVGMCSWGGFSASATKIGMSPLLHLSSGDRQLDPRICISENVAQGVTEDFQDSGFIRPGNVPLVAEGKLVGTLVSPRSAKEYGLENNGAGGGESPCALDMAGGSMPNAEVLERLGTGVYVSNLWYLNFSDRAAGRITGMTRFATLWIEDGKPVGPIDPMRFDETLYNALGDNLLALTREREFDLSTSTYHRRSTESTRVPGALIDAFPFTL
jgi:predicted Zn-dependent protease